MYEAAADGSAGRRLLTELAINRVLVGLHSLTVVVSVTAWFRKLSRSVEMAKGTMSLIMRMILDIFAQIFRNWPDIQFRSRRLYTPEGLVVSEWTASATRDGKKIEWDGIDVFPIEDGKIKRKDVYSGFGVAREIG